MPGHPTAAEQVHASTAGFQPPQPACQFGSAAWRVTCDVRTSSARQCSSTSLSYACMAATLPLHGAAPSTCSTWPAAQRRLHLTTSRPELRPSCCCWQRRHAAPWLNSAVSAMHVSIADATVACRGRYHMPSLLACCRGCCRACCPRSLHSSQALMPRHHWLPPRLPCSCGSPRSAPCGSGPCLQ